MTCFKVPYRSAAEARRSAQTISRGGSRFRVYFCGECRAFHLASRGRR